MARYIVGVALALLFSSNMLSGQEASPRLPIQRAQGTILVDGKIDEPDWDRAAVATDFWQYFPMDTSAANIQSEVRLTYDDQFLYFSAKMYNKSAQRTYVTPSLRRDYRGEANDGITLLLDPFQDNTNAFQFGINPFGLQREGLVANGGGESSDLDLSWDNRWFAEAKQYDGYWVAEAAIPFKTLRYKPGSSAWNIKFYRIDSETTERSSWPRVPRQFRIVNLAYMGVLEWDQPLAKAGGNVAIIPYALGNYQADNLETQSTQTMANFGGDAKIALGPALNLDLTVNPDFSQVEVDEQVTNLDRFEIFFPERRQFFLENADLFSDFGADRLRPFFSRRIGVARDENTGQNVQNPIYFGARVSGKLNNNWRLGLLNMQSARDLEIGQPSVNYSVGAFQRKIFSRSNVGMIFVNKQPLRDIDIPDTNNVYAYNRVLGLDYNLLSADNKWTGKVFYHQSFGKDNPSNAQAYGANISYGTLRWDIFLTTQNVGANYNPETGFVRRRDYRRVASATWLNFYPQKGAINRHGPGFDFDILGNATYGVTDYDINFMYRISFQNTANFEMRLRREFVYLFRSFDPTNSGGVQLPADSEYGYNLIIARYSSDFRKAFGFSLSTRSGGYFNGSRLNLEGDISYRFQPYGVLAIAGSVNRIRLPDPYADANLFLIGPRLDITFSRSLFWTTFIQYNSQIDNLNINSRLQWRFKPVSDLFVVYTDNYFPDQFVNKNRALVVKLTYWLNL